MVDVALHVGGRAFSGWKSIAVDRSIESLAGTFQFEASQLAPNGDAANALRPGQRVSVVMNGQTAITGWIDQADTHTSSDTHTFTISGRDAAGDLVDCAAISGAGQFDNQTMLDIARALAKPFNIPVRATADVGAAFDTWNIEPGETVYENIDRMARYRGLMVISDGRGGIVLTKPGTARAPTALVLGENVLSADTSVSYAERFSEYRVLGQGLQTSDDDSEAGNHGVAKDSAVGRYRPKVEIFEDASDSGVMQKRAEWRRGVNAGRSLRDRVTVQGWEHASGLWQPNTLVQVALPEKATRLIVGVRNTLGMEGTLTELTLSGPKAFDPEQRPDDNIGDTP